jgi:hypothetical protein
MHARLAFNLLATLVLLAPPLALCAQDATHLVPIDANLARLSGLDAATGIAYTLYFVNAADPKVPGPPPLVDLAKATLTAQCSRNKQGKLLFEIFVNFGGIADSAFHAPWTPSERYPYRPPVDPVNLNMQFLGYTQLKPRVRQFERLRDPVGELRYNPPGLHSRNLEEFASFFQYLHVLPTLRLSGDGHTADFPTGTLQDALHKDPLCAASGL